MFERIKNYYLRRESPALGGLEILRFVGPGLLVTVGFIDPGNWASNVAAGSQYGYQLLWVITASTVMLIFLQHNAAHLGIASGLCIAEAATGHFRPWVSRLYLLSALGAAVATALAEILGAAIGLKMLTGMPLILGAALTAAVVLFLVLANGYRRIEKYIIGIVSLIGFSFVYEISLVHVDWPAALRGSVVPDIPHGSLALIMGVMGAVVMPHNLFLHSEIIQSRQWNRENETLIKRQLKFEIADTIVAMILGMAINGAMIIVAAAVFHRNGITVTELPQAEATMAPLLGHAASVVFALALVLAGISSSVTASMAGGSISAGLFSEPFNVKDRHSRLGIIITLVGGFLAIIFLSDPFKGLIASQIALSVQLPWTVIGLVVLTSSATVMGKYRNSRTDRLILSAIAVIIGVLNILLFLDMLGIRKI